MSLFHNFLSTVRRYKVSSALNIAGMAVAFAAFYIILTQVSWNMGYDRKVKDADRVFLMTLTSDATSGKYTPFLPRPVGNRLLEAGSGVENYGILQCRNIGDPQFMYVKHGEKIDKAPFTGAWMITPGVCELFGMETVQGDMSEMEYSQSLALSESFANQNGLKIGDMVDIENMDCRHLREVVAIVKDGPANSDCRHAQVILPMSSTENMESYENWTYPFFVKLAHAEDKELFEKSVLPIVSEMYGDNPGVMKADPPCKLIPLDELYYTKYLSSPVTLVGNRTSDISLLAVGILILLIALVNYINFFFALVPVRIRSVNTYKIYGQSRAGLVFSFLLETLGMVLVSLALAAVLVVLFARSQLAGFITTPMNFDRNVGILLLTVGVAVVTCLAGSVYPALYITSFEPALALKSGFSATGPGKTLRTLLIGFQFVISIVLIISSIFIKLQREYMLTYDLGFDREQLITGYVNSTVNHYCPAAEAFADRMRGDSRIVDVAWSGGDVIQKDRMGWGRDYRDGVFYFECFPVSYNFLDVLGLKVVEGRNFTKADEESENGVIIFNENTRQQYDIGFDTPFNGHTNESCELAGFCNDFHFRPLQYQDSPFAFYVFGKYPWTDRLNWIYVRTEAGSNPYDVMDFITKTILEMDPMCEPESIHLQLFDKAVETHYKDEQKVSGFMTLFTLIAILLSLMGVFGIVLFDTQHRSREIAVRRVLGAETTGILSLFNRRYIIMILVCFVMAAPVGYMVVSRYFAAYPYHMAISWWIFALTLLAVLLVTVAIVTLRSLSAALANPVDSLANE